MPRSMTGFGAASLRDEHWAVSVEVRSVNNRHFKFTAKVTEPYSALEPEIEQLVRQRVRRGTVHLAVRIERPRRPGDYKINGVALKSYREQLLAIGEDAPLVALLGLPGVVEDLRGEGPDPHEDWPALAAVVEQALQRLDESRGREGRAMADELSRLVAMLVLHVEVVEARLPEAIQGYKDRLLERVRTLVQGLGATVEPNDLVREVAIYAERTDVAEEVARLKAHLAEFQAQVVGPRREGGGGRSLEFLSQELLRETNTLGSKANDVEATKRVVEIKGLLESVREIVLNLE